MRVFGVGEAMGGQAGPVSQAGRVSEKRLTQAAHEFEGQMLKELLKPLTSGDGLTGEDAGGGSGQILGEFGAEALGKALSEHGGFGIANRILGQLSSSSPGTVTIPDRKR